MTPTSTGQAPPVGRRWLWIGAAVIVLAGVLLFVFATEDTADVTVVDTPPPAPVVTVLVVAPADAMATITAFAELRPRWDAAIRAAVSGRITEVHRSALAGERVETDTPLFSIEKTQYAAAVTAAELSLEQARLGRWQAENRATVARQPVERDGRTPPNELALRLPELRIAERTVAAAEAQLEAARRQLFDTEVTAPFAGVVTERMVSLGQTVSAGEPLLHLSDDRRFELTVESSQADWALLDHPIAGRTVRLVHRDGTALGEARIRQGGRFLDQETRQPRVFVEVTEPGEGVLAGDFVRVVFPGRILPDTLTLPESALSRAGHVWMVDADNLLQRLTPDILFRAEGMLVIAAPEGTGTRRVAVTPLASFLPGQRVTPQEAEG